MIAKATVGPGAVPCVTRNNRSATLIAVARAAPALALICSGTVVVAPLGVIVPMVSHA